MPDAEGGDQVADSPGPSAAEAAHAEAQRAAEGLKDQIAAIRERVRAAKEDLSGQARTRQPRSFKG